MGGRNRKSRRRSQKERKCPQLPPPLPTRCFYCPACQTLPRGGAARSRRRSQAGVATPLHRMLWKRCHAQLRPLSLWLPNFQTEKEGHAPQLCDVAFTSLLFRISPFSFTMLFSFVFLRVIEVRFVNIFFFSRPLALLFIN